MGLVIMSRKERDKRGINEQCNNGESGKMKNINGGCVVLERGPHCTIGSSRVTHFLCGSFNLLSQCFISVV